LLDAKEKTEFTRYMSIAELFSLLAEFRDIGKISPSNTLQIVNVYVKCFKDSIEEEIKLYLDFYEVNIPLNLLLICVSNPHSFFKFLNKIMQSPDDCNDVIQALYGRSYVN
jgi:hypothetical protein